MAGSVQGSGVRVILASASPRRCELLGATGLEFLIEPSGVDESLEPGLEPEVAAEHLARRKALATAELHRGEPVLVLGADTVVAVGAGPDVELLGKPTDEHDARRILTRLSGSRHRVVTGVAVVDCSRWSPQDSGQQGERCCRSAFERTWVSMRDITGAEIDAYVASGEWRDKAGGYAIQENADVFVTALEDGGFDNVVGLPVELSLQLLGLLTKDC